MFVLLFLKKAVIKLQADWLMLANQYIMHKIEQSNFIRLIQGILS